ncbi:molybdopterin converting factor subunit 1 [Calidifontibacillus erzurumensis]|uniref:Molybdopterin synthase sulfur carrier subunit n=1 Tax=Calidifontibacillus erzurumensis TaxID=2741433 RepID=A0A8J8K849_9BACI|nr:molybdopterin converting factor subunit 1 [Calidifontibacillus erzurumensis]NSL51501.1 molybdopterin converting factor subunit 1 [Calidifontibacillus erzurumensis]
MIKILLFAHLQEAIGSREIIWTDVPISVGELRKKVAEKYNLLLQSVMVAVNEEYADDQVELKDGDTVAFIPPVSGG